MGGQVINEIGNQYGKLKVIDRAPNRGKRGNDAVWICECACGNKTLVLGRSLRRGATKSCGCGALKNEIGNKYGRLTVIERAESRSKGARWLCKCSCGNKTTVLGTNLRRGFVQSCGCLCKDTIREIGKATTLFNGEGAFNNLIRTLKQGAKRRNYSWDLTRDQVRELTSQPCYYCDEPPSQQGARKSHAGGIYLFNGLDRVNNTKGYTIDNVVPCCIVCNRAKRTMTQDEFLMWISQVYKHSVSKEK